MITTKKSRSVQSAACLLAVTVWVTGATAEDWELTTLFVAPTPGQHEDFGRAVAGVGADKVLIGAPWDDLGAPNAGAAYLFNLDGTLLTGFTNPAPAPSGSGWPTFDRFGAAVSAVGADKVLIGAEGQHFASGEYGAVYVFDTNGALLTTLTNPAPGYNEFGRAVAGVGADKVLVGAPHASIGIHGDGAVYLFSTDGTLLMTYTNLAPTIDGSFGWAISAVGADKVLIGAHGNNDSGAAYLFSTDGTLLTTFSSPSPGTESRFGIAVCGVGSNQVIIGDHVAGEAYLFSTDGNLLTSYSNPTPQTVPSPYSGQFGYSVAGVGNDKVLIGARDDDLSANNAGAVYLFGTDGVLLATFANPTPEENEDFGGDVAAVGTNTVIVGTSNDNLEAYHGGAAYLYRLPQPSPSELIDRLFGWVNDSDLRQGQPLLATLEAAWASVQRGQANSAVNQLQAFENKVLSQVVLTDPDMALTLIELAEETIHAIETDEDGN